MKERYSNRSLVRICGWFGVTRQAYYQHNWRAEELHIEQEIVLQMVKQIRAKHKMIGTRKLYVMLQPFFLANQIKMGRDALFDLLALHHLLVRKKKRKVFTTQSHHWLKKYRNLIRKLKLDACNQLWVSDITYLKLLNGRFVYLCLITDAYSKKVLGYHLSDNLESINNIYALRMALDTLDIPPIHLIHHSDRGIQYCSKGYVNLLRENNIRISMTENGDPLENPVAERINGILKQEYLQVDPIPSFLQAKQEVKGSIEKYNRERPHMSCGYLTPDRAHQSGTQLKKKWKTYHKNNL